MFCFALFPRWDPRSPPWRLLGYSGRPCRWSHWHRHPHGSRSPRGFCGWSGCFPWFLLFTADCQKLCNAVTVQCLKRTQRLVLTRQTTARGSDKITQRRPGRYIFSEPIIFNCCLNPSLFCVNGSWCCSQNVNCTIRFQGQFLTKWTPQTMCLHWNLYNPTFQAICSSSKFTGISVVCLCAVRCAEANSQKCRLNSVPLQNILFRSRGNHQPWNNQLPKVFLSSIASKTIKFWMSWKVWKQHTEWLNVANHSHILGREEKMDLSS